MMNITQAKSYVSNGNIMPARDVGLPNSYLLSGSSIGPDELMWEHI